MKCVGDYLIDHQLCYYVTCNIIMMERQQEVQNYMLKRVL